MNNKFNFIDPGNLVDGDLELVLVGKHPADLVKEHVPWYEFEMRKTGKSTKMGSIRFRIGHARGLRYPGHIGYGVNKRYRGHRYAARSCRLLLPLAYTHGLRALWITCEPKNVASQRTCEVAGAKCIETLRIPKTHEMYQKGQRYVRRYRINIKKHCRTTRCT